MTRVFLSVARALQCFPELRPRRLFQHGSRAKVQTRPAPEISIDAAMSLTGTPCPEFHVKVLGIDGGITRAPISALVAGIPAVIHFYNSG